MDGPKKRVFRVVLEYDGSGYHGWQRQPDSVTVQEVVEDTLAVMLQSSVTVSAAGRTDAGVHALGQVAHFKAATRLGAEELFKGLNALLPDDIAVLSLDDADPSFHARFSAVSKEYLYRVVNRPFPVALERNRVWWVRRDLDTDAMSDALSHLVGEHDFTSFCAAGSSTKSKTRNLMRAGLELIDSGHIELRFEADGFLRKMVRNIVGTVVEVGLGKRPPGEIAEILAVKDRRLAGKTAPARGLYLVRVNY